jgi:hypothetical protein
LDFIKKIRGDICNFVFVTGVTGGNKLFTGINDTRNKLSLLSLLPSINDAGVVDTDD